MTVAALEGEMRMETRRAFRDSNVVQVTDDDDDGNSGLEGRHEEWSGSRQFHR